MSDPLHGDDEFRNQLVRLEAKAKSLKDSVTDVSEKVGYIVASVGTFARGYDAVVNLRSTGDDLDPTVASGISIASHLEETLDVLSHEANQYGQSVDLSLLLFSSASSSVVTTCNSLTPNVPGIHFTPCPFLQDSDENTYARRLTDLHAPLGDTYRSAWNLSYTQKHDPGRAALWQMRQVLDHLFERLAPDDAVRASSFWSRKDGNKSDAIHREERLRFAAQRCIRDPARRTVLLESVQETLRSYERLNTAHKRGVIAPQTADDVFRAADAVIRRWIDACDPWPPP